MDNFEKVFDKLFEEKAKKVEMPEKHKCKCKIGKSYCKYDKECKKCVLSQQMMEVIMLEKMFGLIDEE